MEEVIARDFHKSVEELLPNEENRELLFQVLRTYQKNFEVEELIKEVKKIVVSPDCMLLYEDLRPLIPAKQQLQYDRLAPRAPTGKIRVIRLRRKLNENLGFSVRGGIEHGVGIFVSNVLPDSQAYRKGLRVGDEIVRVNSFTIDQAIHEEVLNLIKAKSEIVLKVRTIGMLPVREKVNDEVSWRYVEKSEMKRNKKMMADGRTNFEELHLCIHVVGGSLGCSICSGPEKNPGIYIQSIKLGSLAQEAGLEVGDQIVDVNGTSFFNIGHSEAVLALKEKQLLHMIIWKGTGQDLFQAARKKSLTAEEEVEEDKILELKKIALENERQRQLAAADEEEKALIEEMRKKQLEKIEEERNLQDLIVQVSLAQQAEKKNEVSDSANEEYQRLLEKQRQEARRMQLELREKREQELQLKELKKEEELRKEREKRLDKEKQLLSSLQENQFKELKREQSLKKDRIEQDQIENEREKRRHQMQTPGKPIVQPVKKSPSYLGQKPVLLSPTSLTTPVKSSTVQTDESWINEEDINRLFSQSQIDGRQIILARVPKDGPLDMHVEGGIGSPLGGRIIVSDIYDGGAVQRHGGIHRGDQIMMVNGKSLVDVSLTEAQKAIQNAYGSKGDAVQFVVALSPAKQYEDEVTFAHHVRTVIYLDL